MTSYVAPIIILCILLFGMIRGVNLFQSFSLGIKKALQFLYDVAPTLIAIFIMCTIFEVSGLYSLLEWALKPLFTLLKIPTELIKLILIKPFSGSGSLAYLTDIIITHGADSYIAKCACVLYGSSDTTFYLSAVYFGCQKNKGLTLSICFCLISTFISTIFACLICLVI